MDFKLKRYVNVDSQKSLQLDMSKTNQNINITIIRNLIEKIPDNIGNYVLKYDIKDEYFEVYMLKTSNWVDEYNLISTMAYINIDFFMDTKFMTIKSKSQSGYNHVYKEL